MFDRAVPLETQPRGLGDPQGLLEAGKITAVSTGRACSTNQDAVRNVEASGGRSRQDVLFLRELVETGRFRAVIDRRYPMEQVVEAHSYVETLRKTGNVILTVGGDRAARSDHAS